VTTFERLSNRPLGFSAEHVMIVEAGAPVNQPAETWKQLVDRVREAPGVESVAMSRWTLLSGNGWTVSVRIPGHEVDSAPVYVLDVSPGFFETMRIGLIDGRDLRPGEAGMGLGIVNETFARTYFGGQNPVGRFVEIGVGKDWSRMQIVGYVRDAAYRDVREVMHAAMYVPLEGKSGALLVRTAGDPLPLAPVLRNAIRAAGHGFMTRRALPHINLVREQMLRERLLATLSLFFAIVALALAAIGLYGLLSYCVAWQRKEIGIRLALGAGPARVARRVVTGVIVMVAVGLIAGVAGGMACGRFVASLLFEVKASDPGAVAIPVLALIGAAIVAAGHPLIRAMRIDPAETLRSE
jgi:predicted permease